MFKRFAIYSAMACCLAICVPSAHADIFEYDDQFGTDVMYLDIAEDTGSTPNMLFGTPDITGNRLDFDPTSFKADSNASGLADAELTFILMSNENSFGIDEVIIEERGDFTLSGLGAASALASVSTEVNFTVTEIGGLPTVVPAGSGIMLFTPDASGQFSLADEGISTAETWTGALDLGIAAFLADNNIDGLATKIEFSIENVLEATAANGGTAFIAKKDFNGVTITIVPEPSSLALLGMLVCLAGVCRRSA